ncbi:MULTISPECIES: DinB family protein [Flammeovirga]|uniref:DinB family protein n=1 Tax=Flammeovirga agarivorans TaxID=2726742 RepID=A0A7X8SJ89_9BACT|nr:MULTISPECIES: DinB family protein [Flammeovirga]NLR91229.1 DinB family protein [Flammeovirga agarivorans]
MFNTSRKLRKRFISLVESMSIEDLNYIPEGYNNNIIWNFGHNIVTHQLLCYNKSGLTPRIDEKWIKLFRKGSKPERDLTEDEIHELKKLSITLLEKLDEDLVKGVFRKYEKYVSGLGVTITTVSEAIKFNNVHEGVHIGYALGMKRVIEHQRKSWENQTPTIAIAQ